MAKTYAKQGNQLKETEVTSKDTLYTVAQLKRDKARLKSMIDEMKAQIDEIDAKLLKATELNVPE
jgi:hypothetical protein